MGVPPRGVQHVGGASVRQEPAIWQALAPESDSNTLFVPPSSCGEERSETLQAMFIISSPYGRPSAQDRHINEGDSGLHVSGSSRFPAPLVLEEV